ncbi:tRNA dihydrouridine synthase [Athalassotoga saccharophila]|uniref:tRNA dihydrouridine synthase n=1 Tax=Athalassotoga saccharophila TaxID=1441386 RepID=UPI00137AC3EB|nr:tRNA-dihydrouridine synthase family protein [Athalassotoga saccharophila]BBJ27469.1 putative tRNA-dihydrouridine synthase [Athalassotoga saccharophila]
MIIVLSPMAGVTDRSFRKLCLSMGADLAFTEMISVNGLVRKNKKTLAMLPENEKRSVVQLFGKDPSIFSKAALMLKDTPWIDINAACPIWKVTRHGYGSSLMRDPMLLRQIVESVRNTGFKVSVKIRIGWEDQKNFLDVAKAAEDGGAFLVTIHGRTVEQLYSGKADWQPARILKENLKIKVGISGDIFTPYDVIRAYKETGSDYIFVARGSIGNPWIFRQSKELYEKGYFEEPSLEEKRKTIKKHLEMEISEHGIRGIMIFRKFIVRYLKNLPGSHDLKERIMKIEDEKELDDLLDSYFSKLISCEQGGVEGGNIKS